MSALLPFLYCEVDYILGVVESYISSRIVIHYTRYLLRKLLQHIISPLSSTFFICYLQQEVHNPTQIEFSQKKKFSE